MPDLIYETEYLSFKSDDAAQISSRGVEADGEKYSPKTSR